MTVPADDTTADTSAIIAALRTERDEALAREATLADALAARTAELAGRNIEYSERIEHQTATIDVLKAMSASPGDAQPVFELIATRARDICGSYGVSVFEFDGSLIHLRAWTGVSDSANVREAYAARFPCAPTRKSPEGRAILDSHVVYIKDYLSEPDLHHTPGTTIRSSVTVPMIRGGDVLGILDMGSHETSGFSDIQVHLLKTFAEQAVIAITSAETYRALQTRTSDLQETLVYQTATGDVLKVISRSAFDLQPVLDTVVQTAAQLCNADRAAIFRREGDLWRLAVNFGFPPAWEDYMRGQGAFSLDRFSEHAAMRAVVERRPVQIDDLAAVPGYGNRLGEQRTTLGVPLLREGEAIGTLVLARLHVEPFTDRQIELVNTFADQAVIAVENTRLLTEQREALEQQTATAEVLRVINGSPGELTPVFDAILEKAHRICGATIGSLILYDGECLRAAATHGFSDEFADQIRQPFRPAGRYQRLIDGERFVQAMPVDAISLRQAEVSGVRSTLAVPLRKDTVFLGAITAHRTDVRSFDEREIVLLENFAAQAVIAMENARLLGDLRQRTSDLQEALEQQTATAEVLQIINASPGNLVPVFDTILEKALRLCGADFGSLVTYDGECFQFGVTRGMSSGVAEALRKRGPVQPSASVAYDQIVRGSDIVHIPDITDPKVPPPPSSPNIHQDGARTTLFVALRGDDALLGAFIIYRKEVRLFSDKEIALLKNFAAQAVIAMENARLLTEQREALEQQTATAEVLQVINASPGDLAPVFDAMLGSATRLCEAPCGLLSIYDGQFFRYVAVRGEARFVEEQLGRGPLAPSAGLTWPRIVAGERTIHVRDTKQYRIGHDGARRFVDGGVGRTVLSVALCKDEALLGVLTIYREEVWAFTDKQIALLQNFAAQAVIAMENARLLNEVRQRQEELRITF